MTKSVDQSLLDSYFSLKLFSQKKPVLLKLSHLITLLQRLDQSNEIYFAVSWLAFIIKGRCNTLFKWHLVKCHFDFNCLPLDCYGWIKKHLRRERGKQKYGNEVISMYLSFSNNFSSDNCHIWLCHSLPLKFKLATKFL